MKDNA